MKTYFILLISTIFLFTLIGCSPTIITINENSPTEKYLIKKGDIVEVVLKANPTTGFKWQIIKIDNFKLKIVDETYTAKTVAKDVVGSGGKKIFRIKAIKKGIAVIDFEYFRPFEKDIPPNKKFHINLDIR